MSPAYVSFCVSCVLFWYCSIRQVAGQSSDTASCDQPIQDSTGLRTSTPELLNIVLIGGTGDLAQKYLWPALFDMFRNRQQLQHLQIYVCGRTPADRGRQRLAEILLHRASCMGAAADSGCRDAKAKFVAVTHYHRLRDDEDFARLGSLITENTRNRYALTEPDRTYETGRLVYVASPPATHARLARLLHLHVRPPARAAGAPWIRVVFEKPFGRDYDSARQLVQTIREYFAEDEMYLVDHYLGKAAVRQILPFRMLNRERYDVIWNRHHIERVEIVLKETLDVKGRTEFYEDVGVLRDVMQNHLTELLILIAVELPSNDSRISDMLRRKVEVLRNVRSANKHSVIVGQYASYFVEANYSSPSATPTFAAALVYVDNERWRGVPFTLVSGKKLDEKATYVRVVFRNSRFCLDRNNDHCAHGRREIVFNLNQDKAELVISSSLPKPLSNHKFKPVSSSDGTYRLNLPNKPLAYSTLLDAVYEGQRDMFVNSDHLLASWHVWTSYTRAAQSAKLRLYDSGLVRSNWLDFYIANHQLKYVHTEDNADVYSAAQTAPEMHHTPSDFRGRKLVTGNDEVIEQLASDMRTAADLAIAQRGVFHIAVSGGNTPRVLWFYLVTEIYDFPWQRTHVWIVDERCVPPSDHQSNFASLDSALVQRVPLPYLNVHPMFTNVDEPCGDDTAHLYEEAIRKHLPGGNFDFVILGVGADGHTASIFADFPDSSTKWVQHVTAPHGVVKRITVTPALISLANRVAVLITGEEKHDIVTKLAAVEAEHPITWIDPTNGTLTWYIDHEALFGNV